MCQNVLHDMKSMCMFQILPSWTLVSKPVLLTFCKHGQNFQLIYVTTRLPDMKAAASQKCTHIYGMQGLISVFRTYHWCLVTAKWMHSTHSNTISSRYVSLSFFHWCLCFPSSLPFRITNHTSKGTCRLKINTDQEIHSYNFRISLVVIVDNLGNI